jgi:uncharacterized RDD family membrane protein YckC
MSDNLSILSQSPEPENPYAPPTALDLEPSMAQEPAVGLEYVPFWPRVGARLLDTGVHVGLGLVTGGVVGIIAGVFAAIRGIPFATLWPQIQPAPWMSWISGLVGAILYFVIATAGHGSSLGKLLLGIVTLDESGGPCSSVQVFKRELLYYIDSLFFGLIAYQQMKKSPRQQRLGDEWGDTIVVYRRSAPPRSLRSGLQFTGVIFFAMFADVAAMATPFLVQLAAA